jgi:hypothetical protein
MEAGLIEGLEQTNRLVLELILGAELVKRKLAAHGLKPIAHLELFAFK